MRYLLILSVLLSLACANKNNNKEEIKEEPRVIEQYQEIGDPVALTILEFEVVFYSTREQEIYLIYNSGEVDIEPGEGFFLTGHTDGMIKAYPDLNKFFTMEEGLKAGEYFELVFDGKLNESPLRISMRVKPENDKDFIVSMSAGVGLDEEHGNKLRGFTWGEKYDTWPDWYMMNGAKDGK